MRFPPFMNSRSGVFALCIVVLLLCVFLFMIGYSIATATTTSTALATATTTTTEGFVSENTQFTYFPLKKQANREIFHSFKINDFMRDAMEIPESIKIYKKLTATDAGNTASTPSEYSKNIDTTEIYKKYNTDFKPNETKLLDQMYGDLFNPASTLEMAGIQKKIGEVLHNENKMYSYIQYFLVQKLETPYSPDDFTRYFATVINAYKSKADELDMIKTFLYKIIGKSFIHTKLTQHFKTNSSIYNTKDDILFLLNTTKELLNQINMEELSFLPETQCVYIFKTDKNNVSNKTFTVQSLTLFAYTTILMNVRSLLDGNPHISMTDAEVASMFNAYMEKKYPDNKEKSIIAFALSNPPEL